MKAFLINIFCTTAAWLVVFTTYILILMTLSSFTMWTNLLLVPVNEWSLLARAGVVILGLSIYIHMWRS